MKRIVAVLVGALMVSGYGIGSVSAVHADGDESNDKKVDICTYEVGLTGDHWENTIDNSPVPGFDDVVDTATSDGTFSWGGCLWVFPDSENPANAPPDAEFWNMVEQGRPVDGEYFSLQVSIVDDVWGAGTVGGTACSDADNNYVCGEEEKGEFIERFCNGESSVFSHAGDNDDDGHPDFGFGVAIFVMGPRRQTLECSVIGPEQVGGVSGGTLDPAGGIFLTLSV